MTSLIRAAWVIARRDFTASVWSRSFLFFLLAPLIILSISILFGNVTQRAAKEDVRVTVAVISDVATFRTIENTRSRLAPAMGDQMFPNLLHAPPEGDLEAQASALLSSKDKKIVAVLAGGLDAPRLIGPVAPNGSVVRQMGLILEDARQQRALAHGGIALPPADIALERVNQSAGVLATARAMTARAGQLLVFMLTVLLAGMLLSNMIEEKSNKVIEVLAAAVPVDAIFLGKIFAMLAVSLVGIAVWTLGGALALGIWAGGAAGGPGVPEPAVGWPLFILFVLVYFSANYLLLGALFLGIGSQASSVREVQTMSMPVTVGQMLIFLLASVAMSQFNAPLGIGAAIFPFSSPLMMVARAAQTPELWPHLVALVWQAIWVSITVSLGAAMFRRNVLKSGAGGTKRRWRRRGA